MLKIMDNTADNVTLGANTSCRAYRDGLFANSGHCQQLVFIAPNDDRIWEARSRGWHDVFKVYSAISAFLFLLIGIYAVMLIVRKECIRLKTKTFFAVYACIAILGLSRFLLFALDPFGLIGFIADRFPCWIAISRFIATFAFPSLVASYTLLFFTLISLASAFVKKQWYQKWSYVIVITITPYVIALLGEGFAHLGYLAGLLSALICEAVFTLWGVVLSITYFCAGTRLVRTIRLRRRKTKQFSAPETTPNATTAEQGLQQKPVRREGRASKRHNRPVRKIAKITIITAILGIIYSVINATGLIMMYLLVANCLGYMGKRGLSAVWLSLQIALRLVEVLLVLNMLYSVTDMRKCTTAVKQAVLCQCLELAHGKAPHTQHGHKSRSITTCAINACSVSASPSSLEPRDSPSKLEVSPTTPPPT